MGTEIRFTHDDVFVSYIQPPTLQAMASFTIARAVVYKVISRQPRTEDSDCRKFHDVIELKLKEDHGELMRCVKMCKPIGEIVKQSVTHVHHELRKCDEFFRKRSSKAYPIHFLLYLDYCIWFPNGEIDYEKTAEQILWKNELSEPQKFYIITEFCMEDEIRTFNMSSLPFNIKRDFSIDCVLCYWQFYKSKEFCAIPRRRFYGSLDMEMALNCGIVRNWPAFKYFWNRLGAEDQITLVIDLMGNRSSWCNSKYMLQTLSMMSLLQQRRVISQKPGKVIQLCCLYLNSYRDVLRFWENVKNITSAEQFDEVVLEVLRAVLNSEDKMDVLIKIWKTASDHHKNRVMETNEKAFLDSILPHLHPSDSRITCSKVIYFLQLILSQKDTDFQRSFIFKNTSTFGMQLVDPTLYNEIVTFCLPALDDQLIFKTMVANSKEMKSSCNELLRRASFDVLTAKLRFYLPDEANLREYMKQWLQTPTPSCYRWYDFLEENTWQSGWHKFGIFVDQFFPDPTQATQLKKSFVSSFATQLPVSRPEDNGLKGVWEVIEFVMVGDELAIFKRDFAHAIADRFRSMHLLYRDFGRHPVDQESFFRPKYLIKNVRWCYNEDEIAIMEFQNCILPVNEVFNKFFNKLGRSLMNFEDHSLIIADLNEYLQWYLPNDRERNEFKMARIDKPHDFEDFHEFFKSYHHLPKYSLHSVEEIFRFCCSDDQQAINELKSRHPEFIISPECVQVADTDTHTDEDVE